jgi:hypothetical protein
VLDGSAATAAGVSPTRLSLGPHLIVLGVTRRSAAMLPRMRQKTASVCALANGADVVIAYAWQSDQAKESELVELVIVPAGLLR